MLYNNVLHVLVHQTIILYLNYKSLKTQICLQHAVFLLVMLCIKTIKICLVCVSILINMLTEIKSILYVLFMLFLAPDHIFFK